jgi:hypothetical protein
VSQQQLHHAQICPMIEEVGGKGMTQCMRRKRLSNTCLQRVALDQLPEGLARHGTTAAAGEEYIVLHRAKQQATRFTDLALDPAQSLLPQGNQPLLVALADHLDQSLL